MRLDLTRFCTGLQPSDLHGTVCALLGSLTQTCKPLRSVGTVELLCVTPPLWCALSVQSNMAGTPVGYLSFILLYVCVRACSGQRLSLSSQPRGVLGGGCGIWRLSLCRAGRGNSLLAAVCLLAFLLALQV